MYSLIFPNAAATLSSTIAAMKLLMPTCSGQASTHLGSRQLRQRNASILACSASNPSATSSQVVARASGAATGNAWRGAFGLRLILGEAFAIRRPASPRTLVESDMF